MGYNRRFDWLMCVDCDAIMHRDLWPLPCSFSLSLFFPLHHCFLAKNIKKTRAFKIQNLPESKKEQTKGTKQFSIVLRVKLTGLAFVNLLFLIKAYTKYSRKKLEKETRRPNTYKKVTKTEYK